MTFDELLNLYPQARVGRCKQGRYTTVTVDDTRVHVLETGDSISIKLAAASCGGYSTAETLRRVQEQLAA